MKANRIAPRAVINPGREEGAWSFVFMMLVRITVACLVVLSWGLETRADYLS